MTLAVAACFPWGRALAIARSLPLGVEVERGVVLATDSRFTYEGGPVVDTGLKVYVLEPNVALVFAGDVTAAQRAISDLQDYITHRQPGSQVDMAKMTQYFLQQAYEKARGRKSRLKRRALGPLRALLGVYDHRAARPHVLAYSELSSFVPQLGHGVHAVGAEVDVVNFGESLFRRDRERDAPPTSPIEWQLEIVVAMRAAVENPTKTTTIGGPIQTVVVKGDGIVETSFSYTKGDPMDESSWVSATTRIADVTQDRPSYPGRHAPGADLLKELSSGDGEAEQA